MLETSRWMFETFFFSFFNYVQYVEWSLLFWYILLYAYPPMESTSYWCVFCLLFSPNAKMSSPQGVWSEVQFQWCLHILRHIFLAYLSTCDFVWTWWTFLHCCINDGIAWMGSFIIDQPSYIVHTSWYHIWNGCVCCVIITVILECFCTARCPTEVSNHTSVCLEQSAVKF